MKPINRYIKESVEVYRLNEVEATYNVQPEEIILQAPETFQESDIQQYMDDMWLNALPSSQSLLAYTESPLHAGVSGSARQHRFRVGSDAAARYKGSAHRPAVHCTVPDGPPRQQWQRAPMQGYPHKLPAA